MGRAGFCTSCTGHVPCAPLRAVLPSVWEGEGGARRKQSQGRVWVTLEEMMAAAGGEAKERCTCSCLPESRGPGSS